MAPGKNIFSIIMLKRFHLLTRKFCLVPTLWGWLLLSGIGTALLITFLVNLGPFLSPVQPLGGKALVVEGWLPDYAFDSAAVLFKRFSYDRIAVTGGPQEQGSYLKDFGNFAKLGAATLRAMGIPDSQVIAVPAPESHRDRTQVSALALVPWIRDHGITTFDVCSLGAHARRTRFLFQKAMGNAIRVGVISIDDAGYAPRKWWATSQGFRIVIGELIAYLYVRILFKP
jgi:hypothetical protein